LQFKIKNQLHPVCMASIPMLLNWFAFWILQFLLYCLTPIDISNDLFLRLFFIPGDDTVHCVLQCTIASFTGVSGRRL